MQRQATPMHPKFILKDLKGFIASRSGVCNLRNSCVTAHQGGGFPLHETVWFAGIECQLL
jgi:hypothetical protein